MEMSALQQAPGRMRWAQWAPSWVSAARWGPKLLLLHEGMPCVMQQKAQLYKFLLNSESHCIWGGSLECSECDSISFFSF